MNNKQSQRYMGDWLKLQSKEVRDNLKVISNEDTLTPYLFRIDYDTPKVFTPRLPIQSNIHNGEDFSCPRICTSEHLAGCILGYARVHYDLAYGGDTGKHTGVYEISSIDFTHAVLPNDKLVPDASRTQEVWVVAYSPEKTDYKPTKVGEIHVTSVNLERVNFGNNRVITYDCLIHITSKESVAITTTKTLSTGYYRAVFTDNDCAKGFRSTEHTFESISEKEYKQASSPKDTDRIKPSLESIPTWAIW